MTALSIRPISPDDISAPVSCCVDGCTNMALQRWSLAGYPAGEVCTRHATEFSRVWSRETGETVKVARVPFLPQQAAAA